VFEVRSSLNENPGTIVKEETKSMEGVVVRGVALDKNQAKVTLVGVPDKPGVAAKIFKALGDATVNVDMIVQNISHGRRHAADGHFIHRRQTGFAQGAESH
jgi:aspartate kinase